MTILAWIVLAIVILALLLMVYACMRMARESDERVEREYTDFMARQKEKQK